MISISLPGGIITMHIAPLQHDFNAIKSEAFKKNTQNYAYSSSENINDIS